MKRHFLTCHLLAAVLVLSGTVVCAQGGRYHGVRDLVQRVENDLEHSRRGGRHDNRERERIGNALKHLSDFDRNLTRGRFDEDRLNESIDDVKNVVEHNALEGRDRDRLSADLRDLRDLRANRGRY